MNKSMSPSFQSTITIASKKNSTLPIMIIHIGPRKTATNLIQTSLEKSKNLLKRDSFVYISREDVCFRDYFDGDECVDYETKDFEKELEQFRFSKTNLILSSEMLIRSVDSEDDFQFLVNKLRMWDVRIVTTYRRYFDWLLSEYNQYCNRGLGLNLGVKTLVQFYQSVNAYDRYKPLVPLVLEKWKRYFDDVYIFNMHGNEDQELEVTNRTKEIIESSDTEQDLFTRFICQSIPEAESLCDELSMGTFIIPPNKIRKNAAKDKISVELLLITAELIKKRIVDYMQHNNVFNVIREYLSIHNVTNITCLPTNELDVIYNQSISIEKALVPKFHYSSNGASKLKLLFRNAVSENKFCSVDTNAFLEKEMDGILLALKQKGIPLLIAL